MARKLRWWWLVLGAIVVIVAGGVLWARSEVKPTIARVAVQGPQPRVAAVVDRPSHDEPAASQTKSHRYARPRVEQYLPRDVTDRGPLPPADTPSSALYAQLKSRDDAPAVERLYNDTLRCRTYFAYIALAKSALSMSYSPATASTIQNDLAAQWLRHSQEGMDRYQALCADTKAATARAAIFSVTFQAAQRGDASAAECFVYTATAANRLKRPAAAVIALRRQRVE